MQVNSLTSSYALFLLRLGIWNRSRHKCGWTSNAFLLCAPRNFQKTADELVMLVDEVCRPLNLKPSSRSTVYSPRKWLSYACCGLHCFFYIEARKRLLHTLTLPWTLEPIPDHSIIHEAFGCICEVYQNILLNGSRISGS